jgi:hypothetical protein
VNLFFLFADECFAVSRIPLTQTQKKLTLPHFNHHHHHHHPHPSPIFLTPRTTGYPHGEPSFSERTSTAACFLTVDAPTFCAKKSLVLRFKPRSFFTERYSINAGEASIVLLASRTKKKIFFFINPIRASSGGFFYRMKVRR